ncbi:MAG: hypothetical protein KKD77_20260, partial [Gammaproteobacteria bacterium]|nr:hypothetical protein [Gammaproteobacteria bacterium]
AQRYGKTISDLLNRNEVSAAFTGFIDNPESLIEVAELFGTTTDQVIQDLRAVAGAIIDLDKASTNFPAFQRSISGMSSTDQTLNTMGQKYGWGSSFGSTGNWDMKSIYESGIKPILEMSFDDFNTMAGSRGMSWQELESDATTLASIFTSLGDEVKASRDTFSDLSDSIRDQILGMQTSSDNQADVYERLGIQKGAISDMLGGNSIGGYLGSLGSDAEKASAIQKLQDLLGDQLSLSQEAYERPSSAYQGEYSNVLGGLNELLEFSDLMKSEYQLQYEQTDYLSQIAANTAALNDIPKFASGGYSEGGLSILDPGELVLTPSQQRSLSSVPVTTQNDSGATVSIVIHAYGGDSKEVANEVVAKVKSEFPAWTKGGPVRMSIIDAAKGR